MGVVEKSILFSGTAIVTCLDTTDIVNEAIRIHNLSELAATALGKALTIGAFISSSFKGVQNKLTIIVEGDGPLGKIVVCGDYGGKVRGFVEHPTFNLPRRKTDGKVDVAKGVGKDGSMTVIKDFSMKQPYLGKVRLVNGELNEDFAFYFTVSEQLNTAVSLGVEIEDGKCVKAGGILMQPMPNAKEEQIVMLEDSAKLFTDITGMLKEKTPREIIDFYFEAFNPYAVNTEHPIYECACSIERLNAIIKSMGKKEAYAIVNEVGAIESKCQFCEKVYRLGKDELDQIFKK